MMYDGTYDVTFKFGVEILGIGIGIGYTYTYTYTMVPIFYECFCVHGMDRGVCIYYNST